MGDKSIWPTMGCLHTVVCPDFAKASTPKVVDQGPTFFKLSEGLV